ncbi:hypothetical protein CR513_42183, partial [Mucuna pruriens]
MNTPTTPSRSMGTKLSYTTKLITSQGRKNHDYPQPQGIKELWNCFGSKLRSSVGEDTMGQARVVYPKRG